MTTHFYIPPGLIHGERISLPEDEARHAVRVLRLAAGDEIAAVDGRGGWYRIALDHVGRADASGHVVERRQAVGEPSYYLTLGLGLIKSRSRFETSLEKAVELGVSEIVPLVTHRTEKERVRLERSENVLIAAMKQCGRSRLPVLRPPSSLEEFMAEPTPFGLCCHESAGGDRTLGRVLRESPNVDHLTILVGPEGGFAEDEVRAAVEAAYRIVSLGSRRLRAETAAIYAAAVVASHYESR